MDETVDTMEVHLQRVQRLKRRVEEQGEKISENVYNSILLNSVPETYNIAVNILESQEQLTPSIIINRLLEESRKLNGGATESSGGKTAMLSNTKPGKSGKTTGKKGGFKGGKKDLHCRFCDKDGHEEDRCWAKHPELRPKKGENGGKRGDAKFAMAARKSNPISRSITGDEEWYVDSGASDHFSPYKHLFETYTNLKKSIEVFTLKEGTTTQGIGKGKITLNVIADSRINEVTVDAIYAPDMDSNLLSVPTLLEKGYEISMKPKSGVKILKDGVLVVDTLKEGTLFRLKTVQHKATKAAKAKVVKIEDIRVWHQRLAHLGEKNVRKLKGMAEGIRVDPKSELGRCEDCLKGSQTRHPNHEPAKDRKSEVLGRIHSDICGPIHPPSVGGKNYMLLFVDDATRMKFACGLKTKTSKEVLDRFKDFKEMVELETGKKIKIIRTDGGGEYEKWVAKYLKECGIKHEVTAPYSPEQNGVAERANRTILERTKAILADTELPKKLWMEIASTVVHLKNRSPTKSLKGKTPYEAWNGKKPDLSYLRILGSTVYVHVSKDTRRKLDFNTRKCRLVGYGGTNQWRAWDGEKKDVITSRDVIFDEQPIPNGDAGI